MTIKALSCFEGPGEAATPSPPPLTCREISSTSHSSSHSWATADMATTVATRMATSPIWKGKSHQRVRAVSKPHRPKGPQCV